MPYQLSSMSKMKVTPAKKSTTTKHKVADGGSGAHMKILNAAVTMKQTLNKDLTKQLIPAMTGIQGASTIRNALAKLKKLDYIEPEVKEAIVPTDKGVKNADVSDVNIGTMPSSNEDYHEKVKEHFKLKEMARNVFDLIADGRIYTKDQMASALGLKKNSTFRNLLADLKKKGIVEARGDSLQLTEAMFPFDLRPE